MSKVIRLETGEEIRRISSTRSGREVHAGECRKSSDLRQEKKFEEFFGILLFFEVLMNLSDSKNFFDQIPE